MDKRVNDSWRIGSEERAAAIHARFDKFLDGCDCFDEGRAATVYEYPPGVRAAKIHARLTWLLDNDCKGPCPR